MSFRSWMNDHWNTAYNKTDCIHFTKSPLYSVHTVPVCNICNWGLCCENTGSKNKAKLGVFISGQFLFFLSVCLIPCSCDTSGEVSRFKWGTTTFCHFSLLSFHTPQDAMFDVVGQNQTVQASSVMFVFLTPFCGHVVYFSCTVNEEVSYGASELTMLSGQWQI